MATASAEDCLALLSSEPGGLSPEEARRRLAQFGSNALPRVKGPPVWRRLAAQFTHTMAVLLWCGAVIAALAGMPPLAWAIGLVNVINGVFSFWQEHRAQQATEALKRMLPQWARVRRQGQELRIPAEELVPGDLLLLTEGERISADARLLWEVDLKVDCSILTGESRPVARTAEPTAGGEWIEQPNLIFAGCSVASGSARAVVFATGADSEFGRIAHLTQSLPETPSPLQIEMARLTRTVTRLVLGVGVVFFVLAVFAAGMDVAGGFLFALGMIVAFVPEGLLPTVTLSLAMGVQRMAGRNALLKKLSAVETLGCTNVICTDKTGTLTQNQMTVRELYVVDQRYRVDGTGYEPKGDFFAADAKVDPLKRFPELLRCATLCNDARLVPPNHETPGWTVLGDPTEGALQSLASKAGLRLEQIAKSYPRWAEIPFESRRKRMSTLHKVGSQTIVYLKGAPREVLASCKEYRLEDATLPLDQAARDRIMAANDDMASGGLRVLALATRALDQEPADVSAEAIERDLVFLGLVAMHDPPRPEVKEAVDLCYRAGIRILMITGDYGLTAESVARRIGIVRGPAPRILVGSEMAAMAPEELADLLAENREIIFARMAPEQKLSVVQALQSRGQVVAVTGDGVNDAPALRQADIGVAMGRSGSDVAREAASMVLTDDSFASIVYAIEEGRAVYANLRRFVSYIFTSNIPEAVPFILFALSQGQIPLALTIMQILAIDLGTDMAPALALGAEPPEPGLMDRPPRDRHQPLITGALLARAYLFLGPVAAFAVMTTFFAAYWNQGWWGHWTDLPGSGHLYELATAAAFATVVTTQVGNLFAHRTEINSIVSVGLGGNRLIAIGLASELAFMLAVIYVPWLQPIFGTAPLGWKDWLLVVAWTPALLIADELRKALLRARRKA
jgi:potassium/sodium efflux P-type ATPase